MTFDVSLIKENLVVLPFQQTNIQTNRMTHTDIDRGKDREKEIIKEVIVIVIVVSVVVTAEHTPSPIMLLLSLLWLRPSTPPLPPENPEIYHQRPPCLCL